MLLFTRKYYQLTVYMLNIVCYVLHSSPFCPAEQHHPFYKILTSLVEYIVGLDQMALSEAS